MDLISKKWEENLDKILKDDEHETQIKIVLTSILNYMKLRDWKGACHESCGILYVIFQELGIPVDWKVGEVFITNITSNGRPICFDHSWITYNDKIIDLAINKPLVKEISQPPTILDKNLDTLSNPNLDYDISSGIEDNIETDLIKNVPLSKYFDKSPMHPTLGTWSLILTIGKKVGLKIDIPQLRKKYDGIFWK